MGFKIPGRVRARIPGDGDLSKIRSVCEQEEVWAFV